MKEFFSETLTAHWWLTLLVGSILGHLITTKFDKLAGKSSAWWAARAKTRNDARQERIRILAHDDHEMLLEEFHLNRMLLMCIAVIGFGLAGSPFADNVIGGMGPLVDLLFKAGCTVTLLIGLFGVIWVLNQCDIIYEARKRRRSIAKVAIDKVLAELQMERADCSSEREGTREVLGS